MIRLRNDEDVQEFAQKIGKKHIRVKKPKSKIYMTYKPEKEENSLEAFL